MRIRRDPEIGQLRKRPEFLLAASGRRFHTDRMTLQGRRRAEGEAPAGLRVGFTLTKRVGHATERNRIRRRLRSAVLEAGLPFKAEPVDIVVIGRRDAFSAPFPTLLDDLARGLAAVTRPKAPDTRSSSIKGSGRSGRDGTPPSAPVRPART